MITGKRMAVFCLWAVLIAALTGCGGRKGAQEEQEKNLQAKEDVDELPDPGIEGSIVAEDEEAVYFCSSSQIRRLDKEKKDVRILWESEETGDDAYRYSEGNALLLQDKIYFMERWWKEDSGEFLWALSVVNTDGTGYRRIEEIEMEGTLYYAENLLYVAGYDFLMCYRTDAEDASISGSVPSEELPCEEIPEGYGSILYTHGGPRYLSAPQSMRRYGFYLMKKESSPEVIRMDPETKEMESLLTDGTVCALNQDFLLYSRVQDTVEGFWLINIKTLEEKEIPEVQKGMTILDMDERFLYVRREEKDEPGKSTFFYERIDLESGERKGLFEMAYSGAVGMGIGFSLPRLMDFTLLNGYAYYADVEVGKAFLARRSLTDPGQEEVLGDAFYDNGISSVGTVKSYYEDIYSKADPEQVIGEIAIERIVVDEVYAGAEEINRFMEEYQDSIIQYEKAESGLSYREEEIQASIEAGEETYFIPYSYVSGLNGITYFDGNYFSFCQRESDYAGGAHDMPYARGFTFDLQTGKRLDLSDVTKNSEEELKEIVTGHFAELIGKSPEDYWSDALEVVREETGYDSDFYLTDEGICFYFGPYELACYAMGFQAVVVPYEEFEMGIFQEISS